MKNKVLIILGSAGSGKSHLENELYNFIYKQTTKHNFRINPDHYVEDEESEYYNNPLGAYNHVYKKVIPELLEDKMGFILQNTGANPNTLRKIIDTPNYQFKAVIVYCNPIIAFIRNFSRERKLPKQIVLENWLKVYSQIEEYTNMVGSDNIYVYETEYTKEEQNIIKDYIIKYREGLSIFQYLESLNLDTNSSFKKENTQYTPNQIREKRHKFIEICLKLEQECEDMYFKSQKIDYIKEELNKWIK